MELTYTGGHDAVEVRVPDWGPQPTVANGDSYDFPDAIAELLLEQPDNWQRTEPDVPVERPTKATKGQDKKAVLAEAPAATLDDAGESGEEQ